MKRWFCFLVSLAVVCLFVACGFSEAVSNNDFVPGNSVFFGRYEQDNILDDGPEPIEWRILEVKDGKALLISCKALDCQPYNTQKEYKTWFACSLRDWLNQTFFDAAFTDTEKAAVCLTHNVNRYTYDEWPEHGGIDTQDKVFLPSYAEISSDYFPQQSDRKLVGTEYARSLGAKYLGFSTLVIGETDYWLRSLGRTKTEACYIGVQGEVLSRQVTDKLGIRPMLWLDLNVDRSLFSYEVFTSAMSLSQAGDYKAAADLLGSLDNYCNAETIRYECLYRYAGQLAEAGDYETAVSVYESLGEYQDSYILCREARYNMATAYQASGDYARAGELFGEVGQYKDSMACMKKCFDKQGISIYYFDQQAMKTNVDNGYSNPVQIAGNDQHFGWRMGRFFMSDFTRVSLGQDNRPVFIKTLGDKVTLWFDLEQDIDAVNGNKMLIVGADINGFDLNMNVTKTDFGRGTLIVRQTNYQNARQDPVIYTDYLLAKGTTAADTKVVFFEEGDYDVVLDYELHDNDLMHALGKYSNYQISFSFSIRNGNCMVYPFDIATGAELQNTAVAENGFYLDLARSRYLDIDVRRTELVETKAGIVEDERFNRPAKDGDTYTDTGIYTISVSNRYTGESTVKTIFVGSEELLQQYVSEGFSLDRLK